MELNFKNLRPSTNIIYPRYHTGEYLEEYFFKYYIKNKNKFDATGYTYIPVFWTNCYNSNKNFNIQKYINALPNDKNYFTVCQHDDAPREKLPQNTLVFSAGGNTGDIPIPLICSPIPSKMIKNTNKDIFCSFVGSISQAIEGNIRSTLYDLYSKDSNFYFTKKKYWKSDINTDELLEFIDITSRSIFSLCPRGYGPTSFRLYEVMQLGSIPVYVYNKKWLPYEDIVDWNSICVLIDEKKISSIKSILHSYTQEDINKMRNNISREYKKLFTLESTCNIILNKLYKYANR